MLMTVNKSEWPSIILRTIQLVLDSRPGPNITNFGFFFGQNDRSMSEIRWKLMRFCFESFATSGEHRKYLQFISQSVNCVKIQTPRNLELLEILSCWTVHQPFRIQRQFAILNNMKLVHCRCWLLHLVQARRELGGATAHPGHSSLYQM